MPDRLSGGEIWLDCGDDLSKFITVWNNWILQLFGLDFHP